MDKKLRNQLVSVAKTIKHCGDYGKAFWNDQEKKVFWIAADSDGSGGDEDYTPLAEIEDCFLRVPGVKKIQIEADSGPPDER